MTVSINVPALGESVSEATVSKWFKRPGDAVAMDELLVELETDKVSLEVNAPTAGVLESISAKEGTEVKVGQLLGAITAGAQASTKAAPVKAAEQPATNATQQVAAPAVAPSARKIAEEHHIDTAVLQGTGKGARVMKGDVLAAIEQKPAIASSSIASHSGRSEERIKMSRLRQRIAERLKDSQNTAAILTTFNEVDMSAAMAMRTRYKDEFEKKHGLKLGFMSFFVKATIAALRAIPGVNAHIEGDSIVYPHYYDIGVAVGTEQGLVVPVIRNAETLSFAGIEGAIATYGKKAKEGKISMEDLSGGTFTISNGGVYGSLLSTPIINPPQSGILGMHKIQERPMVVNGQIVIRPMMYLALSYDHRLIDGKEAVTFLVKVKELIESPERLLLDI